MISIPGRVSGQSGRRAGGWKNNVDDMKCMGNFTLARLLKQKNQSKHIRLSVFLQIPTASSLFKEW